MSNGLRQVHEAIADLLPEHTIFTNRELKTYRTPSHDGMNCTVIYTMSTVKDHECEQFKADTPEALSDEVLEYYTR